MAAAPAVMMGLKAVATVMTVAQAVKGMQTPKAPKSPAQVVQQDTPTVMPTEDSQTVAEAKRRALIAQVTRGGRASTVMTDTETFGGN